MCTSTHANSPGCIARACPVRARRARRSSCANSVLLVCCRPVCRVLLRCSRHPSPVSRACTCSRSAWDSTNATASSSRPLRSRAERAPSWLRMLDGALWKRFSAAEKSPWSKRSSPRPHVASGQPGTTPSACFQWCSDSSCLPTRARQCPASRSSTGSSGRAVSRGRIKARAPAKSPRARVSFRFNGTAPNARPIFLRLGSPKRAWAAALGRRNWWWCPGLLVGGSPRTLDPNPSPTDR